MGDHRGRSGRKGEREFWRGPMYKKWGGGDRGVGRAGRLHSYEAIMTDFEMRTPRAQGIPSGEGIPGEVLGIGPVEPGDPGGISSSRRRRNGGANDPQLVEYRR
jgi:hypothetical protein